MNFGAACPSTAAATTAAASCSPHQQLPLLLRVRREPFEYGLLPLPSLIFTNAATTLRALRDKLNTHANCLPPLQMDHAHVPLDAQTSALSPQEGKKRINAAGIAASLELSEAHAQLVLETLTSVLPDYGGEGDPLSRAAATDIDMVGADVDDLILFLYIQNYKRPLPRPCKDAAAVADVWPSTSAFDGFFSSLSSLQVRPSRRTVPSQADEEAHQLAYVQKHLLSLLSLLAEADEHEAEAQVLTMDKFNHLKFLLGAVEQGAEVVPLSQAAPFFANSDPDMPAAPVPLAQVLEWVEQHICSASDHPSEKVIPRENGPISARGLEADVTMVDAYSGSSASSGNQAGMVSNGLNQQRKIWHPEGLNFVDGVVKAALLKEEGDIKGGSVKVCNCHDSVVYLLAPLKYASVSGCSDSIVVLGAVGKVVKVEHCERVHLVAPTARICIANCRECLFYLGVNQRPLVIGDNHNLQVAPYNTFYPRLEAHMAEVGVDPTVNRWDSILTLGIVDPHDSLSHPAGVADAQAEGATFLPPDRYTIFVIPRWCEGDLQQQFLTKTNPFILPKAYVLAQQQRSKSVEMLRQTLRSVPLDEGRKRDLSNAIHVQFKEWLYASGNIRQLYDLQVGARDCRVMD